MNNSLLFTITEKLGVIFTVVHDKLNSFHVSFSLSLSLSGLLRCGRFRRAGLPSGHSQPDHGGFQLVHL